MNRQQLAGIIGLGTLLFLLGCHLGLSQNIPLWLAAILATAALTGLCGCCWRQAGSKSIAAAVLGLFLFCGAVVGSGALRQPALQVAAVVGQQVSLTGRVDAGTVKPTPQGVSFVLDCAVLQTGADEQQSGVLYSEQPESKKTTKISAAPPQPATKSASAVAASGKIRVFVKAANSAALAAKLGGQVTVRGNLKPLAALANPGGWDGELWNELHGLQGKMTVSGSELSLQTGTIGLGQRIAGLAATLRRQLQAAVPGQAGAVLAGMTLGGYDGVSAATRDAFASVGLAHLLAVSGTHIALLTGFLLLLVRRRDRYTLAMLGGVLLFYAALCGFKPPVLRALLMSLALFASGSAGRLPQRSNIFCGILLLLLAYEPRWLWDVGFQLSFVTTAGLLYLYPVISNCCSRLLPVAAGEVLAVTVTAQLAALPFLIHYFHQLSLIGLLANLLLVPMLEIAVLLTLAGLLLLPLAGLGQVVLVLAGFLVTPLLAVINWLAGLSWAAITVGSWPAPCSVIYYLLLLLLFNDSYWDDFSERERRLLVCVCCCALLGIGAYEKVRPQPLTVYFIDVGQGDAALVITPQRQTLLIDTGGLQGDYDTGRRIIAPYLRYLGIRSLDMLLLSHGDHDHAGGAASVAQSVPVKQIILPQQAPSADVQALLKTMPARVEYAVVGQNYYLGNTAVQIVAAPVGSGSADANESSLIVRVADKDGSIVFTGDAPEEEELLAVGSMDPSTVLKVSHHGSNYSSCTPFVAAVSPQAAVISVGAGNSYGHPGSETLQRLAACGAKIWRTDLAGAVKITFDAGQVKCYSYRYQKEFF